MATKEQNKSNRFISVRKQGDLNQRMVNVCLKDKKIAGNAYNLHEGK
jgi:hypothetical protein